MSRPVLPIGNGHERRHEVDRRARGVWRITLASDWSRGEASRVDGQGNDGDRASDNQSAGKDLAFGCGLASLARVGPWGFRGERRDENGSVLFDIRTRELQQGIYNLYTRGRARGDDREGGRAAYSTKAKLWMSSHQEIEDSKIILYNPG